MKTERSRSGLSSAGIAAMILIIGLAAVAVVYVTSTQSNADQIAALKAQPQLLQAQVANGNGGTPSNITLPVMNQVPTIRTITETWYLSPSAHQDRFDPSFIIVNQGDTLRMTLIDNDSVAHDLVIGPPYDIIINATVPGLINDLTGETFKTQATNNSPGVVVVGTPGNVSATYSFVATHTGIFEFVCTYHAEVGMIGYLAVLPNAAYTGSTTHTTTGTAPSSVAVSLVQGAGTNTSSRGFKPDTITVVLGVNNTVVWTNNDGSPHTVTAQDGSFDSANMAPGAVYTYTFTRAGTYSYHCTYHPWMIGTVIVKAA